MFPPRGMPADLDAETARRVARTFLILRMVRGSLLLVFLTVVLVGVELKDWPRGLGIAVGLAMVALAAFLLATWRRYRAVSGSPRA